MGSATSHTQKDARILQDIGEFAHGDLESRMRVYPRTPGDVIRLDPDAAADTWGAWTQIIPAGTIRIPFHIVGVMVENQEGADTWMGQLSCSATPTGSEYLGEWRLSTGAVVGIFPTNFIPIQGLGLPLGCGVWGRVMSAAGGNYIDISVTLTRHIPLEKPVTPWPTWPW